ncbi:germinal-center associated nuclear protein isoform X1 [Carassius gibelio]|uniref:germinal-center associated nuclear protein isoform X1 n=1 Tax=Carassius gibelio TaxID=101364 RepID=UPI002278B9E0|nr:germinal-center associated nuclear protein isoform X1 [Carassius gibelio]XP_052462495.1 germinal-center associated nuclear protein isoform X1 [Carassius gibelio]
MNPSNIFGVPQTAFQAPNNSNQSGNPFQSFSQKNTAQVVGFGQPSAFSQPSFGQPMPQSSVFGQTSSFGQTGGLSQGFGQPSSFSFLGTAPAFGQSSLGQGTLGFGQPPPSYSQATGQNQMSAFGQPSAFGISSSASQSLTSFSSAVNNQPSFGQLSALSVPTATSSSSTGGRTDNPTDGNQFSFNPPNDAVFKPIFSISPEPLSSNLSLASETAGSSASAMTSTMENSSSGSLFSCVKPNTLGFSFSQPAAAPSVSFSNANVSQKETLGGGSSIQFTFSQPANPSSSSTPASQPTTPSTFSFTAQTLQSQSDTKMPAFGGTSIGSFGFGVPKTEAPPRMEDRAPDGQSIGGETAFVGFGIKRKEELLDPNATKSISETGADEPRQPTKRPLLRTRGPTGGLFLSALSELMKSKVTPVKRDHHLPDRPDPPGPASDVATMPPRSQAPTVLTKAEEVSLMPEPQTHTPGRRASRKESTDSLAGLSPTDATVIQCKGIPPNLNKKDLVIQHFGHFGKVLKVYCRPQKNLAIVHFQDHASATKAKKKGKLFQRTEIQIFWQRKKQSPSEKAAKPSEVKDLTEDSESGAAFLQSSPSRKPLPRAVPISNTSSLSKSSPIQKSSVAKILQFESEAPLESVSEERSVERPIINLPLVLQPLIGQVAETAEERYRLLEQRDKILRQARPKRTDLDMSKVFVGTCPDMCPEKERYMRETRNQLSVFEVIPDTEKVDHFATIKEYSRSSADQEEPLPHELRPLPVLSMTMDYLVTQIMDQGEGNYRDWYDFVWNRTRGVRKDITQQHLCDPETVSLIEKCTRFHIHCAHHLCQEPMMSFDTKINNENMTKCLQSLKEMYQDLATKEVYCPNEAEFRQYNVLLKLNDGDILREVQQFRKEVRESREVNFAVQAFAALNSNNFVRFFKLVSAASYLSSCILHRYFNQVRSKALKILNVAFTVGSQRSTIFPVEDFVRTLMFRNASEATDFIQQYGLTISDGMVELSRTSFQQPDFSIPQRKSVEIERKRTVLIGEVVNGGPLPNLRQHNPVCSFDSNNKYTGDGLSSEPPPAALKAHPQRLELKPLMEPDSRPQVTTRLLAEPRLFVDYPGMTEPVKPDDTEETGEKNQTDSTPLVVPQLVFQPILAPQPVRPPSPPPKPEPSYTDQDIMAEVDAVLNEVVEAEVSYITRAAAEYVSAALSVSDSELEMVMNEVLNQLLRELSKSVIIAEKERITEEKLKQEEARRKEAFLEQFSDDLCAIISDEVLTERIRVTAEAEIRLALEEMAACIARCSAEECNSIVEETLAEELAAMAQEILDNELKRVCKFIKRWRDVVGVRRQLKRQMRGFPAAPGCVDPRFKLKALVPSAPSDPSLDLLAQGMVNLGNSGNMAVSCTRLLKMRQEAVHQMKVSYYYNLLLSERVWMPLDLPTLVAESYPKAPDRIFWKATLLLPSSCDSDITYASRILTHWLEVKLGGGNQSEENEKEIKGQLKTLCISHSLTNIRGKTHEVQISIKACHGPLSAENQCLLEEQKELHGTNALLMLLPSLSTGQGEENENVALLSALIQLRQVQQASCWHSPVPLVVVVTGNQEGGTNGHGLEEALMLNMFVRDGLISEYIFVHIPETLNDLQGSEQMSQIIRWLAAHSPAGPVLSSQTLLQVVELGLCREFYSRLQRDKQDRKHAGLQSQHPEPIVQLCNSVLSFLAGVVSSEHLSSLCWPPPEFSLPENSELIPHHSWNSPEHLEWLKRTILSQQLPEWDPPPISASWTHLCAYIFQYVSQIPTSPLSQPILMSRLENLLRRVNYQYLHASGADEEDYEKIGPSFYEIPWDEIICLCVEHRMKDWIMEPLVAKDALTDDGEILVYFNKDSLKTFQPPDRWIEAVKLTYQEIQHVSEVSKVRPHTAARRFPKQRLFQSHVNTEECPSVFDTAQIPILQRFEWILSTVRDMNAAGQSRIGEQIHQTSVPVTMTPSRKHPAAGALHIQETETADLVLKKSSSKINRLFDTDSAQTPILERLQRTLSTVQEMNAEGQRIGEQIQSRIEVDHLSSTAFPLFLPSTLLYAPPLVRTPSSKHPAATVHIKEVEQTAAAFEKHRPGSLLQRLQDLKRELWSQKEEERVCDLKLKCLLDIIQN